MIFSSSRSSCVAVNFSDNFKPPAVQNASGVIKPTESSAAQSSFSVQLTSEVSQDPMSPPGAQSFGSVSLTIYQSSPPRCVQSGEQHSFAGKQKPQTSASKGVDCILFFDEETGVSISLLSASSDMTAFHFNHPIQ